MCFVSVTHNDILLYFYLDNDKFRLLDYNQDIFTNLTIWYMQLH